MDPISEAKKRSCADHATRPFLSTRFISPTSRNALHFVVATPTQMGPISAIERPLHMRAFRVSERPAAFLHALVTQVFRFLHTDFCLLLRKFVLKIGLIERYCLLYRACVRVCVLFCVSLLKVLKTPVHKFHPMS